ELEALPQADRQGGRRDRQATGADEDRPGAAAAACAQGEAARAQAERAAFRRAAGAVLRGGDRPDADRGAGRVVGAGADERDRDGHEQVRQREALLLMAGAEPELEEDGREGEVIEDQAGGEPGGAGAASGGVEPTQEQGSAGSVLEEDE